MTDVIGDASNVHPLTKTLFSAENVEPLNGSSANPLYAGTTLNNYYPAWSTLESSHLPVTLPSDGQLFTQLLARTNPSRPGVTPLSLLQDLRDIPHMLRDVGKLISKPKRLLSAREIANQNLGIQFGWLPLVRDVHDLLSLQSSIHKRIEELQRLHSSQGLRRRLKLNDTGAEKVENIPAYTSGGGTVSYKVKRFTKVTQWGTVRWIPSVMPPYHPTTEQLNRQARQVVSGLSYEGLINGAWDLIPWSFIVDWFTDVSTYALSYSNTVPAVPTRACLMTHYGTVSDLERTDSSTWWTGGKGYLTYESKIRSVSGATVNAFLPFVGVRRLSILGSLFIQRFKG